MSRKEWIFRRLDAEFPRIIEIFPHIIEKEHIIDTQTNTFLTIRYQIHSPFGNRKPSSRGKNYREEEAAEQESQSIIFSEKDALHSSWRCISITMIPQSEFHFVPSLFISHTVRWLDLTTQLTKP